LEEEVEEVLEEEKQEKQIQQAEMQVTKGQNLITHEDEIHSRPKRTWFESEKEKKAAKDAGAVVLNGVKRGITGKLSGKKRRKLENRDDQLGRGEGRVYKKTKEERVAGTKRGVKVGSSTDKKPKSAKKFAQKMGRGAKGKPKGKGGRR